MILKSGRGSFAKLSIIHATNNKSAETSINMPPGNVNQDNLLNTNETLTQEVITSLFSQFESRRKSLYPHRGQMTYFVVMNPINLIHLCSYFAVMGTLRPFKFVP